MIVINSPFILIVASNGRFKYQIKFKHKNYIKIMMYKIVKYQKVTIHNMVRFCFHIAACVHLNIENKLGRTNFPD